MWGAGKFSEYDSVKLMRNHFLRERKRERERKVPKIEQTSLEYLLPISEEKKVAVLWYHPLRILES